MELSRPIAQSCLYCMLAVFLRRSMKVGLLQFDGKQVQLQSHCRVLRVCALNLLASAGDLVEAESFIKQMSVVLKIGRWVP